jgi:hypothetical protein
MAQTPFSKFLLLAFLAPASVSSLLGDETAKQENPGFVHAGDGVHPGKPGHVFIANSVYRQLWSIWKLPGDPKIAAPDAIQILTKHTRPGVPAGLPLDEACCENF